MDEISKKKRPFEWRKYALLMVVLVLVGRAAWRLPRRGWSLKDSGQRAVTSQDLLQRGVSREGVRHVVLISIDTCRADHLGCYGYSRKTSPNLDTLAAEGIIFNHAVAAVPITLPSHSSMLTGTLPLYHRVRDNNNYRLDSSNITLAEILRENGFVTGAVIGAFVLDSRFGLDQGFDTYIDDFEGKEEEKLLFGYSERKGEEVTRLANEWLEQNRNKRLFLFLHYFDPHGQYIPHRKFPFTSIPFLSLPKDCYDSEIAYTDHCIGQVIKKLKELNLYDSTLLIVTGDHGESLGQHSEKTHAYFIYHSTLHVPLIFKLPQGPEKVRINSVVGLIDIVPTVCGVLGIPVPPQVQGEDLSVFFSNKGKPLKERYLYCESLYPTKYGLGPFLGLVSDRWKYIHTSSPELYDLENNPDETKNLLDSQPEQTLIMQNQLKIVLQDNNLGKITNSKMALDEEAKSRLRSLGYVSSRAVDEDIQFNQTALNPKDFVEVYNLTQKTMDFMSEQKFGKAKKVCADMLGKWPGMKAVHFYLGLIAGYEQDTEGVVTHFSRYLEYAASEHSGFDMRVNPTHELSVANTNIGVVLKHRGQTEQAIAYFKNALLYNPYAEKTSYDLACCYLMQGKLSDAARYYTRTLELDPSVVEAHYYLGDIMFRQNRVREALAHWDKVLKAKPDWVGVLNNIAWCKGVYENEDFYNPNEALQLAQKTCELTGHKDPRFLDTLSVVYSATGRFGEAVETAENAIELALSCGQNDLAEQIKKHLKLYEKGKSYREPATTVKSGG